MKEFIVTAIAALDAPHTITDTNTGQTYPMVSLQVTLMSPPSGTQAVLLHFPPTLLRDALPKLQATIQLALMQPKEPGARH
jgi:hypothetical protein